MLDAETWQLSVYAAPMGLIWGVYWMRRASVHRRSLRMLRESREAGLEDPPSLHPRIDPAICIGCRSCVTACPEGDVLGIINGKAHLVNPAHCIGHGACRDACPTKGIELVFGTARRGIDIPLVHPDFETNVPGLFIAGELGGMGLIQNAVEQGRQAVAAIAKLPGIGAGAGLDVVIVGAGPAGFSASLAALAAGLRFVTLEQEARGGTVAHYPRGKIVMTAPMELALVGKTKIRETTKEALLAFWEDVERRTGLQVQYGERVESIQPRAGGGFTVESSLRSYQAHAVLLAIGRRGTPRKLEVPGEQLSKVVYRLVDPCQYDGQRVLVVGGGDSALEAATALAERPGTTVTLSYRGAGATRARQANRERLEEAAARGRIDLAFGTTVEKIGADEVVLGAGGTTRALANDAVIVCAGGILPTQFLKDVGVHVETKYGTA
jgi:thioredoxin reductase/Pyruvate/2-oxoacid:ferredoxin oxidoreductase delta subunit